MDGVGQDEVGPDVGPDAPSPAGIGSADGSTDATGVPDRTDPRRRSVLVALSLLLVVALVGAVVLWRARGRAGTTERVRLEWTCGNGIFWPTPGPSGGESWWAGHDPVTSGPIQTGQGPGTDLPRRWADGVLRFDTDDSATFVSDAGGTMALRREPSGMRFHTADCRFGSLG